MRCRPAVSAAALAVPCVLQPTGSSCSSQPPGSLPQCSCTPATTCSALCAAANRQLLQQPPPGQPATVQLHPSQHMQCLVRCSQSAAPGAANTLTSSLIRRLPLKLQPYTQLAACLSSNPPKCSFTTAQPALFHSLQSLLQVCHKHTLPIS